MSTRTQLGKIPLLHTPPGHAKPAAERTFSARCTSRFACHACNTDLSSRRVFVTEYVDGLRSEEIAQLDEAQRDHIGEIVFRFFFGLLWRERIVAGDPHPDNCLLCPDGRVCLLDFALLRGLEHEYLDGERAVMRAVVDADPDAVDAAP